MFAFNQADFACHGLKYVDKTPADIADGEACFVKEGGFGVPFSYRMCIKLGGQYAATVVPREEFKDQVILGRGHEYIRDLVTETVGEWHKVFSPGPVPLEELIDEP